MARGSNPAFRLESHHRDRGALLCGGYSLSQKFCRKGIVPCLARARDNQFVMSFDNPYLPNTVFTRIVPQRVCDLSSLQLTRRFACASPFRDLTKGYGVCSGIFGGELICTGFGVALGILPFMATRIALLSP